MIPDVVVKRDGTKQKYDSRRILTAMAKTGRAIRRELELETLNSLVTTVENGLIGSEVARDEIDRAVIRAFRDSALFDHADEYETFSNRRKQVAEIKVASATRTSSSTDIGLLIEADRVSSTGPFDIAKITHYLEKSEIGLSQEQIDMIAKRTENKVFAIYEAYKTNGSPLILDTSMIRALVAASMAEIAVSPEKVLKAGSYGLPREDLEQLIFSKSKENANVGANNPEAVGLSIWETILKKFALHEVFSKDVREAHLRGAMHLHDLGYIIRVYCSAHSPAYLKKYGLKLDNLDTSSSPAKHAITLSGHISTFLASMQANYAGALGESYLNLEFAPFLRGMAKEDVKKVREGISAVLNGSPELVEALGAVEANQAKMHDAVNEMRKRKLPPESLESTIAGVREVIKDTALLGGFELFVEDYKMMAASGEAFSNLLMNETALRNVIAQASAKLSANPELKAEFEYLMGNYTDMKQVAQNLIFTHSQSAFSRGGQTLFIDFNLHTGVPAILADIPIILPGGTYGIVDKDGSVEKLKRIKDSESRDGLVFKDSAGNLLVDAEGNFNYGLVQAQGKRFVTYKDYEKEAQQFLDALLDVYYEGDEFGKMFAFPKCDLHVGRDTFEDEEQIRLLKKGCRVAAKNSSTYFIFDRDAVTLSACCRLKASIDPKALEHPESLRFCGFQNVTINIPQAAYRALEKGRHDLDGLMEEIWSTMDLAYKAHIQKKGFIGSIMNPSGPLHQIGKKGLDGKVYVDLDKSTYIIGMLGLNEAVKIYFGKELHESEEALQFGLKIIAGMNQRVGKYSKQTGLTFSLEESPAESAARNLAKRDVQHAVFGRYAKRVVCGTEEDPYYTNSVHMRADAPISGIDRIKMQSYFHPAIESGSIIHLFTGEEELDPDALFELVKNVYEKTQCSQLTVSGAHSFCKTCGTQMRGLKDSCTHCGSSEISRVEKVVGYNSKLENWNPSKVREAEARARGNYSIDSTLLSAPEVSLDKNAPLVRAVVYGKHDCSFCDKLKTDLGLVLKSGGYDGKVVVDFVDLSANGSPGMENTARAMRAGMNFKAIPGIGFEYNLTGIHRPVEGVETLLPVSYLRRDSKTNELVSKLKLLSARDIKTGLDAALKLAEGYAK
jgi:anaerobic ribonucleoside-triphosphate reductase